jgi:hypothetical protein
VEPTLKGGDKVYFLQKNIATKQPSNKLDHKKLGLFEITEIKSLVNYCLKLPKTIKIHPVFYVSLLKLAPLGSPLALKTEV